MGWYAASQKIKCSGGSTNGAIRRLEAHGGVGSERTTRTPVTAGAGPSPSRVQLYVRQMFLLFVTSGTCRESILISEYIAVEGSTTPQYIAVGVWQSAGGERCQTACKPGSVRGRPPTRWPFIWGARRRAPRATDPGGRSGNRPGPVLRPHRAAPTWPCSRRGLPCRTRCRARGALLPHPFTLARRPCGSERAVCSLWHFPWGRPRRALPGSVFPWSPDFPPPRARGGDGGHPAVWPALTTPAPGLGQAALNCVRRQARSPGRARPSCRRRSPRRRAPGGNAAGRRARRRPWPCRTARPLRGRSRPPATAPAAA